MGRRAAVVSLFAGTMRNRRRTEITIETEKLLVVTSRKSATLATCSSCAGQVKMVTAAEAAILTGIGTRSVYRWIEEGRVHFLEPSDGLLLVCLNSLYHSMASREITPD